MNILGNSKLFLLKQSKKFKTFPGKVAKAINIPYHRLKNSPVSQTNSHDTSKCCI